jgi:SAM-dependent methyltransferase
MNPDPNSVRTQYEQWPYPKPIEDLQSWLENHWQWYDPSHAQMLLWPERHPRQQLEILIAGCGTYQAAVIAFNNPEARVLGIDVSQAAIRHHQTLKTNHKLDNLELKQLSIADSNHLDQSFDLIIATGVLHHLEDPTAALRQLGNRLKADGCIGLMLYAHYGRIGVAILQQMFSELHLDANPDDLAVIEACLKHADPLHPIRGYQSISSDLATTAGLIDTFLPKREHTYTVADCLKLVSDSSLQFQDWLFKNPYYPKTSGPTTDPFWSTISKLAIEQQWGIMERLKTRNACHFFMACKPERGLTTTTPPSPADPNAVPVLRWPYHVHKGQLHRKGQIVRLSPHKQTLVTMIPKGLSIEALCTSYADKNPAETVNALADLWRLDVIAIGRPVAARRGV